MKKLLLISLLIGALPLGMAAQDDDLYFVPKKKSVEKVADDAWSSNRHVYYSGSNRSVDEYNRRGSYYETINGDSTMTDVINFSAEKGVYPDSLTAEDFKLTRKMNRFEDYELKEDSAYWAGYQDGRYDWGWHSPWYYRYGWYDPWYWDYWYTGWYDPWYYGYYGWGYPYYGWRHYYDWYYPHYTVYVGGGGRVGPRRSNTGTINHYAGTMSGRNYTSRAYASGSNYRGHASTSRLGATRQSSLRNRTVGGHSAYNRSSTTYSRSSSMSDHSAYQRSSSSGSYTRSSSGYSGGGFSGGGGSRSGGFSGGRSGGGGHVGGRR